MFCRDFQMLSQPKLGVIVSGSCSYTAPAPQDTFLLAVAATAHYVPLSMVANNSLELCHDISDLPKKDRHTEKRDDGWSYEAADDDDDDDQDFGVAYIINRSATIARY